MTGDVLEIVETPVGPLVAGATARGVRLLEFGHRAASADAAGLVARSPHVARLREELAAYFAGALTSFGVPLDLSGTPFRLGVWRALRGIPCGETRSYGALARAIGKPDAVRAVGLANGANHVAIVVPCHRVIGAGGRLTGYGGGLAAKRWLLEHEGAPLGTPPLFAGLR